MDYTSKLIKYFTEKKNDENIELMSAYLRNKFSHLGIKKPERQAYLKSFVKEEGWPEQKQLTVVVKELWQQPEREYQYLALNFLERYRRNLTAEDVPFIEMLIITKSWWDTVDGLAANETGAIFKNYPELIPEWTSKWMNSENIWLQRTCILFQLKYKANTDLELLSSFIEKLNISKEFFIQKAIGWILREYSKTNPEFVKTYVRSNPLMPLSRREALKVINKRRVG